MTMIDTIKENFKEYIVIKRRNFLIFSSMLGLTSFVKARGKTAFEKEFDSVEPVIREVQEHLFPEGSKIPSAKSMHVTEFMFATMKHKSFDKDIREFVLEGAKELMHREKNFISLTTKEKEKALRAYEETNYGSNWLSRMMTLTMEAMFSDPIYGSNVKETGWKALGSFGGQPRPKTKYIKL